ncbi:MAG: type III-B CRISPR-associated protein Cas10/Cmr2 [Candidatus Bathyarchaeia archaeon]
MCLSLDVVRVSALLHDIGKLDCWANRKRWSEHAYCTYKFVKSCLGEEIAEHAMRHHTGVAYSEDYRPKTVIEKIVCLADNIASGADRREVPEGGSYIPSPPVELTHVLSANSTIRSMDSAELAYIHQKLLQEIGNLEEAFKMDSAKTYRRIYEVLKRSDLRLIPADTRRPINDVSLWNHLKLTTAIATCIFLQGYKGENPSSYRFALLSGDADRISSFINESLRLQDLNARSQLIEKATEAAGEAVNRIIGPECLLYAAGGSFLIISPPEIAEKILDESKKAFESVTRGRVTMTVSYIVDEGGKFKENYSQVWENAQRHLRLKKSQRTPTVKVEVDEDSPACDVCGKTAATKEYEQKMLPIDASPRPEMLCDFCWNLREDGKGVWLNDLKRETNFVACIKADGDNIGKALAGKIFEKEKASTPSRVSTLSDILQGACERLKELVAEFEGRCVYAGGDDLLAFVPGERGLEAAKAIASKFKEVMAGKCSMSIGVAIFHYRLPVYVGVESAGHLLSRAKDDGKDRIAFAVVGGSGITLSELAKVGSWSWQELDGILEIAQFMRRSDVTSSQIRKIAKVLSGDLNRGMGPERAKIFVMHQMGRGKIDWSFGEKILSYIETGLLLEAFSIYNLFKGD